jgi:hypothetical protein
VRRSASWTPGAQRQGNGGRSRSSSGAAPSTCSTRRGDGGPGSVRSGGARQTLTLGGRTSIVIPVGITLSSGRWGVHVVGALLGLIIGVVTIVLYVADAESSRDPLIGLLVTVLAPPLGWAFAPLAASPGFGNAFLAAASVTILAVPLGAILVAAAMSSGLGLGGDIAGSLAIVLIGLLFLGLPLAIWTFVVACIWVGLLRLVLMMAGIRSPEPAR